VKAAAGTGRSASSPSTHYAVATGKAGFALELDDAIAELNAWIAQINVAGRAPAA
jgi:hypothetical protein